MDDFCMLGVAASVPAIREIADRLDGRPAQAIVGGGAQEEPVRYLLVTGVPRHGDDDEDEPDAA
jgi:hypothetical protein